MSRVDVGFAENCEKWEVESRLFPSKLGGKPAWLDPSNIPTIEDLQCESCRLPMVFLCQIYAPYEEDDDNFHRTLFVFVCRTSPCDASNIAKVFRSSLRRDNAYYSFDPPIDAPVPDLPSTNRTKLCRLCGCRATKRCAKCKTAAYCCRQHQVLDWKDDHKTRCGEPNRESRAGSNLLFDEYEIVIEPEETEDDVVVNEAKELRVYETLVSEGKAGTMWDVSEGDLDAHSSVGDKDEVFARFRKRVGRNAGQVLRYERGGEPLWIASGPKPGEVPDCEYCGSVRQFEFQIMPQMLAVLKDVGLDWGVLVVYTCKSGCRCDGRYNSEYVFKQDVSVS